MASYPNRTGLLLSEAQSPNHTAADRHATSGNHGVVGKKGPKGGNGLDKHVTRERGKQTAPLLQGAASFFRVWFLFT